MAEKQTCGMGLAENSPFPGTLSDVVGAIAANLEAHMTALEANDENSQRELNLYKELAAEHREIANLLKKIASQMADARDLPMGGHDQKAGGDKAREAFESLVEHERELLELLTDKLEREQKMLGAVTR